MSHNPESSSAVMAYRAILPERARRRIHLLVSVSARRRVKRAVAFVSIGQLVAGVRGASHRATHREFHAGSGHVDVRDGSSSRVAHVHQRLTSLSGRQASLDQVVMALEGAGVDYFVVPDPVPTSSAVAVEEADAERTCRVLSTLARETGGYWRWVREGEDVVPGEIRAGTSSFAWSADKRLEAVRLVWFRTDPQRKIVLGEQYSCEVQFWRREGDHLVTGRRNRVSQAIAADDPVVQAPGELFTRLAPLAPGNLPSVCTRQAFTATRPDIVKFPIDVVYTWVDGADEKWRAKRAASLHEPYHAEAAHASRYLNRDEMLYSLRSIAMYAPWVRHIYVVTDDQVPSWLDPSTPGITVVDHTDIFVDQSVLPTFNSHSIESQLHHIDGLSEHFLYFNDDMLLGAPVTPEDFFYANGIAKHFPSPANVPSGDPSEDDVPVSVAAKNNRALIRDRFGSDLTQKMKHAPYALRRDVLREIEEEFGPEHRATASHSIRDRGDLSIASSLHHYYALETSRSVPSSIRYTYVDLGLPDAARRLGLMLAAREWQAMCLNSTSDTDDEVDPKTLVNFLETYYPVRSPHER